MPITPFHFGPGILIKSAAPRKISWAMFALANVAIDLEPIVYFVLTGDPAHRHLHTYLGAGLLALACALLGRGSRPNQTVDASGFGLPWRCNRWVARVTSRCRTGH